MSRTALVIGGGPAGLTVAHELLKRTDVRPIVFERTQDLGGISKTVAHNGNRIDIGGHRFFSKSDRVMDWWLDMLPMQRTDDPTHVISYQNKKREVEGGEGPDPEKEDRVMLVRNRKSRIYYMGKFFDYPISPSVDTLAKLGLWRTMKIGTSYMRSAMFPIKPEENLEQFFINRFGRELYGTFFREYTEKVWGTPCDQISAEWGAQRIKGLSITKALMHALKSLRPKGGIAQKEVETSLIERFLYPKYGPGQMWDVCAEGIEKQGGEIRRGSKVVGIVTKDGAAVGVKVIGPEGGEPEEITGDFVFSTMPVRSLIRAIDVPVPDSVRDVAQGLQYRDFITVGVLLDKMTAPGSVDGRIDDNWIYIQEPGVKVGRMQIFNNWSPYLVADPSKVWVGLEFFCNDGDELWSLSDDDMMKLGVKELAQIKLADERDVRDTVVLRMPKTYPAYFGTYDRFSEVREWIDGIRGLYLLGRNGQHRYNNQDHSMLTAMVAVDNIVAGNNDARDNIWSVNTEQEYHEEKDE